MLTRARFWIATLSMLAVGAVLFAAIDLAGAQEGPPQGPPPQGPPLGPPGEGPGGFGGPRGGRGFGPPGMGAERKLLDQFDADKNGWLDREERQKARAEAPAPQRGFGGRFGPPGGGPGGPPGGPRGFGGRADREPPKPGRTVEPGDVPHYPDAELYDPTVLRTLFLTFESDDWEEELEAFHNTDVEVPATLTVDGKTLEQVGVGFRGQSSYMMVPRGAIRSLNISLDETRKDQNLYGHRTLNLLNANGDASLMSSILYSEIARQHIPAPRVNFVHVVINGESWGVYVSAEQYNKDFLKANYNTTEGARWKVDGSPMGDGGLRYLGEEIEPYRERFTLKSKENEAVWRRLIELCRTLEQTPPDQLEEKLAGLVDLDNVLWFLALDVALVNSDGYWVRASDYSLYLDPGGRFHFIPHDMNEAFRSGGGPGGGPGGRGRGPDGGREGRGEGERRGPGPRFDGPPPFGPPPGDRPEERRGDDRRGERPGGPGGMMRGGFGPPGGEGGPKLDPLVGIDNPRMPLRSKLLQVPSLRKRYLENVRAIAETALDWETLGPKVAAYRELIAPEVEQETRRLSSPEAFRAAVGPTADGAPSQLEKFVRERREFLLRRTEELLKEQSVEKQAEAKNDEA